MAFDPKWAIGSTLDDFRTSANRNGYSVVLGNVNGSFQRPDTLYVDLGSTAKGGLRVMNVSTSANAGTNHSISLPHSPKPFVRHEHMVQTRSANSK